MLILAFRFQLHSRDVLQCCQTWRKESSSRGKTRGQGIKHSRVWVCSHFVFLSVCVSPLSISLTQSVCNCNWGSGQRVAKFPWFLIPIKTTIFKVAQLAWQVSWNNILLSYNALTVRFTFWEKPKKSLLKLVWIQPESVTDKTDSPRPHCRGDFGLFPTMVQFGLCVKVTIQRSVGKSFYM